MASRGRGRGTRCISALPPGSRSPVSRSDPIGEVALNSQLPVQLPERPNLGKTGREIALITNHFEMRVPNSLTLYHYDVEILQGTGDRKTVWTNGKGRGWPRNEIRDLCFDVYRKWASDNKLNVYEMVYDRQKNLYTVNDLRELGHQTTKIVDFERQQFYITVTLCNPATVVLSPETLSDTLVDSERTVKDRSPLQVLDLITNQFMFLMYSAEKSDFIQFGRMFLRPMFDSNKTMRSIFGRVIYEGFSKSLRVIMGPASKRDQFVLSMNIDTKKAPFFKEQPLIETILSTLNLRGDPRHPLSEEQLRQLNRHLTGLRVKTTYKNPSQFVICSFTGTPCDQQMFNWNGRRVSIADYHKSKYNCTIKYPMLPCVRKRGMPGEFTYFPIEACTVIAHQKVELKRMNEEMSRELIKVSAVPPDQRLADIQYMARFNDESPDGDTNHFISALGVERSKELMRIGGRVLEAPRILYNSRGVQKTADVRNGQWNFQNQQLYLPAKIDQFAVVAFAAKQNVDGNLIQQFIKNLALTARNMGVSIPQDFSGDYCKDENADAILRHLSSKDFKFVICILGDHVKTDKLKNTIKLCEVKYTIVTQCIRARTVLKCTSQPGNDTYKNIVYKINAKNGGVNNEIHIGNSVAEKWLRPGIMYVGMDVNHPPPLSKSELAQGMLPKEPSVVGAVANCGRSVSDYRMLYYLQDARKEEISEKHMVDIMTKFVNDYASTHKNTRPESIIVYRDGVSEGQFRMVVDKEILAMKQAFAMMTPSYDPKLTVLTVQKRHNTRFFQERLSQMDRSQLARMKCGEKNIPAGTVVDTGPVNPKLYDFFLCSHTGIQGTSKPSYYVVMLDENRLSADELQQLTFMLCHDYQRCSKSVSLPAPCYHAHHAATRGKSNYLALVSGNDDSSSGFSSGSSSENSQAANGRMEISYDLVQKQIEYGPLMVDKMVWM